MVKPLPREQHSQFCYHKLTSHAKTYTNGYPFERLKTVCIAIWGGTPDQYNWFDKFVNRDFFKLPFTQRYFVLFTVITTQSTKVYYRTAVWGGVFARDTFLVVVVVVMVLGRVYRQIEYPSVSGLPFFINVFTRQLGLPQYQGGKVILPCRDFLVNPTIIDPVAKVNLALRLTFLRVNRAIALSFQIARFQWLSKLTNTNWRRVLNGQENNVTAYLPAWIFTKSQVVSVEKSVKIKSGMSTVRCTSHTQSRLSA